MSTTLPPITAIIFDCDGTLVDSETLSAQLMSTMLAERGIAISQPDMLLRMRGHKFLEVAQALADRHPAIDPEALMREYRARSYVQLRAELQPIPGAIELVRSLRIKKCVASNGPREKIETCLAAVGLLDAFEGCIVSAFEVGAWKPDPALILHAAAVLDTAPSACLLIEDSVPGIRAGLAAGVRVLGYGEADFSSVIGHPGFTPIESLADITAHLHPN
jgi:HAD superfamily hydrolase (TIGR01509 family)